ncbi:MAG: energy-coupling factor ABC transporter ATP-binding protein [Treponema sp.]|nr:energy-coupling factor ABC transporter ATP-binding protein [Treponema sp.]
MGIVRFENVSFKYPRSGGYALSNINFSVVKGEFLAVMGENGAGKTTFCKLINGIIPHLSGGILSGNIFVDGIRTDESSVPHLASIAGIVLDDPDAQLFTSTVYDEAAFGLENILLPPQEIKQRVEFALAGAALTGLESRVPSTLSGGEKQRLSIAAALAMKGKILVLDEPLSRLDPQGAAKIMSVLHELKLRHGLTIIMAEHNSAFFAEYADRICVLKNGAVAALDTPANIFANNALLEENGIQPLCDTESREHFTAKPLITSPKTLSTAHEGNISLSYVPSNDESGCSIVVENDPAAEAVRFSNFCFSYSGGISFNNFNLVIKNNEFTAITGCNGCGKTTLLKNIAGLLRPMKGDIFIRNRNIKKLSVSEISKEAGFVMQNPGTQLFCDSVFKEVSFALKNMHLSKQEIKKRVNDALETAGLTGKENTFPHALCRSDRTRVVIACLIAMGCKIMLFDEVDVGNDYKGCINIMDMASMLHSRGFTIVFVTHNISLVKKYARRVIRMDLNGITDDFTG